MSAQDFPVTFGYGATDGIYYYTPTASNPKTADWVGNYHRGDDRAMKIGTSILVNNVQIGLSGTRYGGAHLHTGRFVNGVDTNPHGQGFTFNDAVVTEVSSDPTNGMFVRIEADGASWVYLHLSKQSVTVGQVLQQGNDMSQVGETEFNDLYRAFFGPMENNPPTADDRKRWIGAETNTVIRAMEGDPRYAAYESYIKDLQNSSGGVKYTPVTEQLYRKG